MLELLDALAALDRAGTMTRAATDLRVSQSAVSKRIAALEDELGVELVEPHGRRVRLTAAGEQLLARTRPLVAELRRALDVSMDAASGELVVGVSESILGSWGPAVLERVQRRQPGLSLALHAHRGPVAIDRVRSGEYAVALVAGLVGGSDLAVDLLGSEEMVLVARPDARPRLGRGAVVDVLSIEPVSTTWRAIEPDLQRLARDRLTIRVTATVESFTAVVQLARAGFGVGLAPRAMATALALPGEIVCLPPPRLRRPVQLCYRKSALARPLVSGFRDRLTSAIAADRALRPR